MTRSSNRVDDRLRCLGDDGNHEQQLMRTETQTCFVYIDTDRELSIVAPVIVLVLINWNGMHDESTYIAATSKVKHLRAACGLQIGPF